MRLLEWLCGCDSPHRNETAQYISNDCNGIYTEKKPVIICTEPKPEQTQITPNKKISHGYPSKPVNGFPPQNGLLNGKGVISNGVVGPDKIDSESFSVPIFSLVENDVQGYKNLVSNVKSIMTNRESRLEHLMERKQLPNEVDEDVRAARGKIIVIVKNNLATFDRLLQNATNEAQQIADLTGFWGLVHKELLDVQKACERVEIARLNGWKYVPRLITPPPFTPSTRSKIPLRAEQHTPNRTPRANPNLRAFMAQKRKEMQSNEQLS